MNYVEKLAAELNGMEYGTEPSEDIIKYAKNYNIEIVYWYSDDCTEFRGLFDEELGSYNGRAFISNMGRRIKAECGIDPQCEYTFSTDIPHATFDVSESGDLYCIGIVFEAIYGEKWFDEDDDEYKQYLELKERFE